MIDDIVKIDIEYISNEDIQTYHVLSKLMMPRSVTF